MTLIVEDGSISSPSANTYATQDYVATFCSDRGLTEWADLASASLEEQAIHRAMSYIDTRNFKGWKVEYDQPCAWPREGVYDEDGYLLDDDAIPARILRALARASYEEAKEAGVLQETQSRDDFTSSERVDVISVSYEPGHNEKVFRVIDGYLRGLTKGYTSLERT
jgi:hypothetical protein